MRRVGGGETTRHVLIDGNNVLHKAHHAYVVSRLESRRPLFTNHVGFHTGRIYGFLNMISSWLHGMVPISSISVFFDGIPKRRLVIDPLYKANRKDNAEAFHINSDSSSFTLSDGFSGNDVEIIAHILTLLGCDVYHHPDEEADDLIASFCSLHPDSIRMVISDDKDFFQLLTDPRIVIYRPGSNEENRFYDFEKSKEHWAKLQKGKHPAVPPDKLRMFKSLCGDQSDEIIGVERLRKRVAIEACHLLPEDLRTYDFPGFSATEKQKTLDSIDRIIKNYQLVGLNYDIDLAQCIKKSALDMGKAFDILRNDLDITSVDVSQFRECGSGVSKPKTSLVPDWLSDI